jgi:O-antigen/teichoic acid export membrane protein
VGAFSGNLPRYSLEATQGSEAVGLFAVAAAPLTLLGLGNSALNQATLARAAQFYQRGELGLFTRLARQITFLQITVSAALAIVLALFGKPIMRILFSTEFVSVAPIAALMAAGVAVGALGARGSLIITAARNFELQLWNILLVTAAQIPLCWWLIGRQGLAGAGWSEFARYAISATFLALAGMAVFRERAAQPAALEGNAAPSPAPLRQAG